MTGNVYFTNSESDSVTKINGSDQLAGPPIPVGLDPFGIAADPARGFVYVGLRLGNNVVVLSDAAPPPPGTGAKIDPLAPGRLPGRAADGLRHGLHRPTRPATVEVRVDGALAATATLDAVGSFTAQTSCCPARVDPGGNRTITAYDPALPALTARPRPCAPRAPICPSSSWAASPARRLVAEREFKYEIPGVTRDSADTHRMARMTSRRRSGSATQAIGEAMLPTGNDKHFYPLRLDQGTGSIPLPDPTGGLLRLPEGAGVGAGAAGHGESGVDVYEGLYDQMATVLAAQGRMRLLLWL